MGLVTHASADGGLDPRKRQASAQARSQALRARTPAEAASRMIQQAVFSARFWQDWVQSGPPGKHEWEGEWEGEREGERLDEGASGGRSNAGAAPHGTAARHAADLLAGHRRLLVVSPHPDDEVLMCSGLMQAQLQRGGALEVLAVTDGEACFGDGTDRAALGLRRRAEAKAGLRALSAMGAIGAHAVPTHYFGLPDGAVANHERALEQRLCAHVRAGDVVVCTWRLDGHPDHDATGRACAAACAARNASLLEAPVWMWHWARPEHPSINWHQLVRMPLGSAQQARKQLALQCHESQITPSHQRPPIVDEGLQARARWPFECFFAT